MAKYNTNQDIDGSYKAITGNEAFQLSSTWTYVAGTTGATGAHTLFSVTGSVAINVFGLCTTDLTSGGAATVEVGTASSTACLCNQQTATDVNNHMVYHDAVLAIGGQCAGHTHPVDEDIIVTVGTTTVTGGVIEWYCQWRPLSSDGNVTVATPA